MKKQKIITITVLLAFTSAAAAYMFLQKGTAPSVVDTQPVPQELAVGYFAGGCFWCVESDYEKMRGVKDVVSGYMGGAIDNPTYKQVAAGSTGHRETVKVVYDPTETEYRDLVLHLIRYSDPTDSEGSFYDRGFQYSPAIYYSTDAEKQIAEEVIAEVDAEGAFEKPLAVSVEPAGEFWLAEEYHQDYHKKNPVRYKYYRNASGRDDFVESVWGDGDHNELFEDETTKSPDTMSEMEEKAPWETFVKPSDEQIQEMLTPLQYKVTQKEGTERAFDNEYNENKEEGIYVDILSGEPLFASVHKYDSGTGWPSFWQPITEETIVLEEDRKLFYTRTEVRSKYGDSHIGHVFDDGPDPTGKRYCMNSAAMRFVPLEDMEALGYGEFLHLFEAE